MSARPPRRILILAYTYPPMPSIGSSRWESMARHLRALGHEVRVITTGAFGSAPDDGDDVVRTADLTASPWIRRVLRRPPLVSADGPAGANSPAPAALMRIVVPDPYLLSWVAIAAVALRREVATWRPDCLVTTSPYESVHVAPLLLGARRPPWLVDLRDGWRFEPHRLPFYTRLQDRLDAKLEARALTIADGVLCATMPIAEDVERRLGIRAAYVPNGWDPVLGGVAGDSAPPLGDTDKVTLAYTGTLSGSGGRDPRGLLSALRTLLEEDPDVAGRLELVIAGQPGPDDAHLVAAAGVESLVRHVGRLPRPAALALQRGADAVLLLTSPHGSEATGKLFEYLACGRPIVALTGRSEAARIVEATSTGVVARPDDPDAIAALLRRVVAGELELSYASRGLEAYFYPAPARAAADEVERAIAARSRATVT